MFISYRIVVIIIIIIIKKIKKKLYKIKDRVVNFYLLVSKVHKMI